MIGNVKKSNLAVKLYGLLLALVLLTVPVLVSANGFTGEALPNDKTLLKVTILLYSGRENPYFYIQDQKIVDRLSDLIAKKQTNTSFKEKSVIPGKLGYSGIIIENLQEVKGLPQKLSIYNNNMKLTGQGIFVDNSEFIETFVLDLALKRKVIDNETRQLIRTEANK